MKQFEPQGPREAAADAGLVKRARRVGDRTGEGIAALWVAGTVLALSLCCAVGWLVMRPEVLAVRCYQSGVRHMGAGRQDAAHRSFARSLAWRPDVAEVHLAMGFNRVGLLDPAGDAEGVGGLMVKARRGDTADLVAADVDFAQCISIAGSDTSSSGGTKRRDLICTGWMGKSMTALLRAAAAYDTGHGGDGDAWISQAHAALSEAAAMRPDRDLSALRLLAIEMQREYHRRGTAE